MTDILRKLADEVRRQDEERLAPLEAKAASADHENGGSDETRQEGSDEPFDPETVDRIVLQAMEQATPKTSSGRWPIARKASVAALLFAAVFAVLLIVRGGGDDTAVPIYTAELIGGESRLMGPDAPAAERVVLRPDSRISLTLRPADEVEGEIGVRAFLVGAAETRSFEGPFVVAPNGAVRLSGETAVLFRGVPAGAWEMVVFVGRKQGLPRSAEEIERASNATDGRVRVLRRPLLIEGTTAILWRGCYPVADGCELGEDRSMTFWTQRGQLSIRAGPTDLPTTSKTADSGVQARTTIPPGTTEIVVESDIGLSALRFALREPLPRPTPPQAETQWQECQSAKDTERARCALVRGVRARLVLRDSNRFDEGLDELRASAEDKVSLGRADALVDESALAFYLIIEKRSFSAAREAIGRARALASSVPAAAADIDYLEALIASETGDLRRALPLLRRARKDAERLGLTVLHTAARQAEAHALVEVGRREEARLLLDEVERESVGLEDACQRGDALVSLGWLGFELAMQESSPSLDGPERQSRQALEIYRTSCDVGSRLANALTGLAAIALARGDVAGAAGLAAEGWNAAPKNLDVVLELLDIQGRAALSQNLPERALDAYARMGALAAIGALPRSRVRAAVGEGEAQAALGNAAAALEAFREAGDLVAGAARLVPLGQGRDGFFDVFSDAARAHVEFLLATDVRAAARATRMARARGLDALRWQSCLGRLNDEKRRRWELSWAKVLQNRAAMEEDAVLDWQRPLAELERERALREARSRALFEGWDKALAELDCSGAVALDEPAAGEALLVAQRLRKGVALMAVDREQAIAAVISDVQPAHVASGLESVSRVLEGARRVRVLAEGPLDGIDWHALPFRGTKLGARVPVVYGLDLHGAVSKEDKRGEAQALVVADPRNDLPAVRRGSHGVEEALRARGFSSVLRVEGDDASHERVLRALAAEPGFFHYAGHAEYAGTDGAESKLFLASDTALTMQDLLALPRAPSNVVLIACEGGRSSAGAAAGLGLGQALVLAGAGAVLAASRPVRSDEAAAFMKALYEGLPLSGEVELGELLRAAVAKQASPESADWAAFRAIVP